VGWLWHSTEVKGDVCVSPDLSSSSCRSSPWSPCLLHPSLAADLILALIPCCCILPTLRHAAPSQLSVMPDLIRHPVTRSPSREETHLPLVIESFRLTDVRRLDPGSGAGVTERGGSWRLTIPTQPARNPRQVLTSGLCGILLVPTHKGSAGARQAPM
jgi:hypothetical protein